MLGNSEFKPPQPTGMQDANIAEQMSQMAPDVDTFIVFQEQRNRKEFGMMAPKKGVSCTPQGTCIKFLKLLKDYLEQSKSEMNYIEAKRAQDKLKELSEHELQRQCRKMERKQRDELI